MWGPLIQCHGPNVEDEEGTEVPDTIGHPQESRMITYTEGSANVKAERREGDKIQIRGN